MSAVLRLEGFGVSYGDKAVLDGVNLVLPPVGLTSLVGPSACGKSTLLRTIAGLNDANPHVTVRGRAELRGVDLRALPGERSGETRPGIGLVVQHAKFFVDTVRENLVSAIPNRERMSQSAQQHVVLAHLKRTGLVELTDRLDEDVVSLPKPLSRRLAVARAMLLEPALLMADEPLAGLEHEDAVEVVTLLRRYARTRAVLFVTHNQEFARAAGGTVALLAEGTIQEVGPADRFFFSPQTECGRRFVDTGGYARPAAPLDTTAESTTAIEPPPPRRPRGFIWLVPGKLGGLPRPGLLEDLDGDLSGLKALGVTLLVTLEEEPTIPSATLEPWAIRSVHFPIWDMGAPGLDDTHRFITTIRAEIESGEVVGVHCRAGLGRTGTMLAAYLVANGDTARGAIDRVRSLNPMWIQSQAQLDFLRELELHLRETDAGPMAAALLCSRSSPKEQQLNETIAKENP